jgi:putative hydrolase of HD superfamily
MNPELSSLLDFVRFTHEIRNVRRAILLETDNRKENDSEHMYQLALTAWYLIEKDNLKLDKYKAVAMALVHDIVEAYTGDIPAYSPQHNHPSRVINERLAEIQNHARTDSRIRNPSDPRSEVRLRIG